jgi:hypothetical protein|eukprot:COSAG01_NODE_5946_length_3940_cov_2.722728_4_plen_74_part_00
MEIKLRESMASREETLLQLEAAQVCEVAAREVGGCSQIMLRRRPAVPSRSTDVAGACLVVAAFRNVRRALKRS